MLFRKTSRTLCSKKDVLEISLNSSVPQSHQEVLLKQMAGWCPSFSDLVDLPQVFGICMCTRFPDDTDTWVQDCILRSRNLEHRLRFLWERCYVYLCHLPSENILKVISIYHKGVLCVTE